MGDPGGAAELSTFVMILIKNYMIYWFYMTNNDFMKLGAYDDALEDFSLRSMAKSVYLLDDSGAVTLTNPQEVEPPWRFPDLTRQVEYLMMVMARAIEALPKQLGYLRRYDRARAEIRGIVDLPDQRLNSLLQWLDDGGGKLSNNKRKQFAELTEDEISRIQQAYAEGFAEE
jgi:hypothetical protein